MKRGTVNLSLEATTERNILKYLNNIPSTKAVKWSQEGRQKGMPDIICVHNGLAIMIEVKKEGEVQTDLQKITMDEWIAVGTICMVATRLEHVVNLMETIMRAKTDLIKEGKL